MTRIARKFLMRLLTRCVLQLSRASRMQAGAMESTEAGSGCLREQSNFAGELCSLGRASHLNDFVVPKNLTEHFDQGCSPP